MVKKKKRYSAKTKGRMLVIFMIFGVIICTLVYTLVTNIKKIRVIDKDIKNLDEEILTLKDDGERLEADIKRHQDPEYRAKYVREKYLYSRDGELILRIIE